jgi:uncharacterized membrane protein YdbT with pleckstrin-like domain
MTKKISVKIGLEILVILGIPLIFMIMNVISEPKIPAIIITIFYFLFVFLTVFGIKYSIQNEFLVVKNGIFGEKKIPIKAIYKIEKTWNIIAAPAPAILGRIEIYYGTNSIVISPKNLDEFSDILKELNPNIDFKI